MPTIQYTLRNVPSPVDRYLRKRAQLGDKSLNQTIIDELSEKIADASTPVGSALDWFIGSGIDNATLQALKQEDRIQKDLAKKELLSAS